MNVWIPLLLSAYVAAAIWLTWEMVGRPATVTGQRVPRHLVTNRPSTVDKTPVPEMPVPAPAEPVEPREPEPPESEAPEPEVPETDEVQAEPEPEHVFDPLRDPLSGDYADPALWPGTEQLPRLTDDLLAELDRLHRTREPSGNPALSAR